jgi:hypothetical protein
MRHDICMNPECPICHNIKATTESGNGDYWDVICPRCGSFSISGSLFATVPAHLASLGLEAIAKVSFSLRELSENGEKPFLKGNQVELIVSNRILPDLNEQGDRLVKYAGKHFRPGVSHPIRLDEATGCIGAVDINGTIFVIDFLAADGYFEKNMSTTQEGSVFVMLTKKGWDKYQELVGPPIPIQKTPLYPQVSRKINDFFITLDREKITPWIFLNTGKPLNLVGLRGEKISYEGVAFEGSPRDVFWQFIPPFLSDFIAEMVEYVFKECKENGVEPEEYLDELALLLKEVSEKIYNRMAEIERSLRGKGNPATVALQDTTPYLESASALILMNILMVRIDFIRQELKQTFQCRCQ